MQIFISYAHEDRATAEAVHFALVGAGHRTFFDKDSLPAGHDYHGRIAQAIAGCDVFVFLVSTASITHGSYTLTELKQARTRWPNGDGRVLPVVLESVPLEQIPKYLTAVTMVEPEGDVAAEVALAVAQLSPMDSRSTPPVSTPAPVSTMPTAAIHAVNYTYENAVPSPMGPRPGLHIVMRGGVRAARGHTIQLVVKFAFANGPALFANVQEPLFRDPGGLVATGTQLRVLASDDEVLTEQATIPFYALNLQPTGGMVAHNLTLVAFLFVDQVLVAQSAPIPFGLRW